jgi:hypothetical protein
MDLEDAITDHMLDYTDQCNISEMEIQKLMDFYEDWWNRNAPQILVPNQLETIVVES